jgi:putative acetyltransferase
MDGRVIGHIAFLPVTISDGTPNWYGLGPVSVSPEHQRKGIGKELTTKDSKRMANKRVPATLQGAADSWR